MKKLIIFGAGGFVAAFVVSTLICVLTAPPPPPVVRPVVESADAPKAPATQTPAGHAESVAQISGGAAKPEDTAKPADALTNPGETKAPDNTSKAEAPPVGRTDVAERSEETAKPTPPVAQPALATGAAKATEGKELKLLAKILTNMKPADAAKVLKDLPDEQVQRLIVAMGPRSAATVLSQLPPERAAALSRRLLEDPMSETP